MEKAQNFSKISGAVFQHFRRCDGAIPNTLLPPDIENTCTIESVPRLDSAPDADDELLGAVCLCNYSIATVATSGEVKGGV